MNIAVIFAGGVGRRMKTSGIPKQFLKINSIPIIIYTLRVFQEARNVDAIVIAGLETHIDYLNELITEYNITKVKAVVPGGETGQQSITNALNAAKKISKTENDIVLIHDGVRPIIDEKLINKNIENVKKYGTSISCVEQKETTIISKSHEQVEEITTRSDTYIARAPQSFYLEDILQAENNAINNNDMNCNDSCTVMKKYGKYKNPYITLCNSDNLKITTPDDYYIVKALLDQKNNKNVWGL